MPFNATIYRLASVAREKLCREAAKASHDLRALVAHANLLDELLVELSAPRGGVAEHYGFDLIPRPMTEISTPRPARPIVVTVLEGNELELDEHLVSSTHAGSLSAPPSLYHDYLESDSDSGSDSDSISDDGDEFETEITSNSPPASPASSVAATSEDEIQHNERDISLHRTKSGWKLLGHWSSKQHSRQKEPNVNTITTGVEEVKLRTT